MPLVPCISYRCFNRQLLKNSQRSSLGLLVPFFIAMLSLSGCSVSPDSTNNGRNNNGSNNNSENLKSISQRIIDWVNIAETEPDYTSTNETSTPNTGTSKNRYLEQEAQKMRNVSSEVITTYKQALGLMEQKKWQAALAMFDQVIAKEANLSGSYINKALIFKYLSEQASGKEKQKSHQSNSELLINKAIKVNPQNPYAQHLKGRLLQSKGEFEQAEKSYLNALLIWPNYSQAQLSMAILLELYRGKLISADHYYRAYLANQPEDQQVKRWQAALAIKIKRAGLSLPTQQGEQHDPNT